MDVELGWNDLDIYKVNVLLPIGFLLIRVLVFPIQVVKTHLQVSTDNAQRSGLAAMRKIVREGGFRGLYQGLLVNSVSVLSGPIYFAGLEYTRHLWLEHNKRQQWIKSHFVAEKIVGGFVGGACASAALQMVSVPIDILTQHQMMQKHNARQPSLDLAREMLTSQGVRAIYRGYWLSLMLVVPSSGLTWSTFFASRSALRERLRRWQELPSIHDLPQWQRLAVTPTAAAFAGLTSALLTNPLDVIKTRMQLSREPVVTFSGTLQALLKQDGYRGLTRGLSARSLSSAASMFVILPMYEFVKWISVKKPEA